MNIFDEVLHRIDGLEPFPKVAVRILELTQGDANQEELVSVLETDPGLTGKVLGLANSAMVGAQVEIESLQQATLRLGFKAVANLALTSGSAGFFKGYGRSTARSNESLWTESMHTALNARRIAARDGRVDSELAYTVGLLQNIGHIVIDRFQKEQKEAITAELEKGTDLLTAERAVLGIDHAQAGALMIRRWGLPRKLIRGIQFHHAPARAAAESVLWAICAQAEELTGLSLGTQGSAMVYKTDGSKWDLTLPDAEERDVWLDRNREEIAAAAG